MDSKQCHAEANTPLEKVYCQVLEKGRGSDLPNFRDFQRNNVTTQRLLLLGPSRKLGILLPDSPNQSPKRQSETAPPPPKSNVAQQPTPPSTAPQSPHTNALESCSLNGNQIICPRASFYLTINIPAKRLAPQVLEANNVLSMRKKMGNESKLQYLSDIYPYYIKKMLLIGLGDSTLSFTKFDAIYDQSLKQSEDFSVRFSKMYELLKGERKSMAIKTRYRNNYPDTINQCMPLNKQLVACDNIEQNWVYQRLSGT